MKLFSNARLILLLLAALAFGGGRAGAAVINPISGGSVTTNGLGVAIFYSTNYFYANVEVTNLIVVTNLTGQLLVDVAVTNEFSSAVEYFAGAVDTNENTVTYTVNTNGSTVVFNFQELPTNAVATMYYVWQPRNVGELTNTIIVGSGDFGLTNTATLVLSKPVYSANSALVVSNYFVSLAYITNGSWFVTNDWITYGTYVYNVGPGSASGLTLTNELPPGVVLLKGNPVNSIGKLAAGTGTNFLFTVRASTNGAYGLTDVVGIPSTLYDPESGHGTAVEDLLITNFSEGTVQATFSSGQKVNLQNGLLEQTITVKNTNSFPVDSVRVAVTGLSRQLYNATGTNLGVPYVAYPAPLAAGQTVNLRLQYNPRTAFSYANSMLHGYGVPATVLHYTPPPGEDIFAYSGKSAEFYRIIPKADAADDTLLEFLNNGGASFTVVYETLGPSNTYSAPMIAAPAISSTANRIQWLDYGPPATVSAPSATLGRMYWIYVNP